MEKQKKKQRGITLIALVISIIVMLILAGVSLNMTIGDNGIISQAQNATKHSGLAALEDFIQEEYFKNYDYFDSNQENQDALFRNLYPNYFYSPHLDDNIGFNDYVLYTTTDEEGNLVTYKFYLIKKEELPDYVKESLVGGDANGGGYYNYSSLTDVYGITAGLKVFYCADGLDSAISNSTLAFNTETQGKVIYDGTSTSTLYQSVLNTLGYEQGTDVTLGELNSVKNLKINQSGVSLKELYNLAGLETITIENVSLASLDGIENAGKLTTVKIHNSTIQDYKALTRLERRLTRLDLYCIDDTELDKCFTDISTGNFSNLKYLAVTGNLEYLYTTDTNDSTTKSAKTITTTAPFAKLSATTKSAVKYMSLQCNNIESLSGLSGFTGVLTIRLNNNNVKTFSGLEGMAGTLISLNARNNQIGSNESTTEKQSTDGLINIASMTKLNTLDLRNNQIVWVEYINRTNGYGVLWLAGNSRMNYASVGLISDVFYKSSSATIDSKYLPYLTTSEVVNYANKGLTDTSSEITLLKNMSAADKQKVKTIDLSGNPNLSNTCVNETLSGFTKLIGLDVSGNTNITSCSFVSGMTELKQFWFMNTSITDLTPLNSITTIKALKFNNNSIDLTTIQPTISRSMSSSLHTNKYYTCGQNTSVGFQPYTQELYSQLEDCTALTIFCDYAVPNTAKTQQLDLSRLSSDINFTVYGNSYKFPNKTKYIYLVGFTSILNTSLEVSHMYMHTNGSTLATLTSRIKNSSSLQSLSIDKLDLTACSGGNITTALNNMNNYGVKNLIISHCGHQGTGIYIDDVVTTMSNYTNLTSLTMNWVDINTIEFVKNMPNLTTITCTENDIHSLKPLKDLTGLTSINFNDNSIANLSGIEGKKTLHSIQLVRNALTETFSEKDEDGNEIVKNNLQILLDLHPSNGGTLTTINLTGNTSITNYDLLKTKTWSGGLSY